jgi:hypothetical protein
VRPFRPISGCRKDRPRQGWEGKNAAYCAVPFINEQPIDGAGRRAVRTAAADALERKLRERTALVGIIAVGYAGRYPVGRNVIRA